MTKKLTEPQRRFLAYLAEQPKDEYGLRRMVVPRQVARAMWPDSPGWNRRTHMYGGHQGAVGGTMPMKAATVLWRLQGMGLVSHQNRNEWTITGKGERVLTGAEAL